MDTITTKISEYVQRMGISIAIISERTGFSYGKLYPSLCPNPTRKLRGDELLAVCNFLNVDPMRFYSPPETHAS